MQKFQLFFFALVVGFAFSTCNPTDPTVTPTPASTRTEVIGAYDKEFGTATNYTWNGTVSTCRPGYIPQDIQNRVIQRIEYYRNMVGLKNPISLHARLDSAVQAACMLMERNGQLLDNPDASLPCYSPLAYEGCANSHKLGLGLKAEAMIDWFMQSASFSDVNVQPRSEILYSKAQTFGYGASTQYSGLYYTHNATNATPANLPEYIAYPPKGFVMWEIARNTSRWSFAKPGATIGTGSTVTMRDDNNNTIPLTIVGQGWGGDNRVVWEPNINYASMTTDKRFTVTVGKVKVNGVMTSFTYDVTVVKR